MEKFAVKKRSFAVKKRSFRRNSFLANFSINTFDISTWCVTGSWSLPTNGAQDYLCAQTYQEVLGFGYLVFCQSFS